MKSVVGKRKGRGRAMICAALAAAVLVAAGCATTKADVKPDARTEAKDDSKPAAPAKAKTSGAVLFEGFEGSSTWFAVGKNWGDGDTSKSVALSKSWASQGSESLELAFNPMTQGKGATCFTEMMDITDFSPYEAILVDVKNATEKPMQVAVAVTTGSGWAWYESNVVELPVGETKDIRVELFANNLKTASTNWQFTSSLLSPDDVRRVALKFFGPEGLTGSVFVDNIRLAK